MSVELIDELEAGELSVTFEGEEPQEVIAWALERFSPRIGSRPRSRSTGSSCSTGRTTSTPR